MFTLHPKLKKDTLPVGDLPCCRVLLMNDRRFPWLILVPRQRGLRELFDLAPKDYAAAMSEVREVSTRFAGLTKADKMNVAALGNAVPQLHIHIIARFKDDPAWPAPVWNSSTAVQPYPLANRKEIIKKLRQGLNITKM